LKRIIDYLPLISACLLYFGFCNLYYYYKEFNVDIYSFVSSSDVLLSFFPKIVLFTSLIYSAILQQLYDKIKKPVVKEHSFEAETEPKKGKTRIHWWRENIYWFVILFYLPISLISLLLQKAFHYKPYELSDLNRGFDFLFLALIYIAVMIHEKRDAIFKKPLLIALFLIVFIGQKIGSYRTLDAQKVKDGKSEYRKDHLEFSYKDSIIKTTDSLLFVGETATHIFLYNLKDSSTRIYPFSSIEKLQVK